EPLRGVQLHGELGIVNGPEAQHRRAAVGPPDRLHVAVRLQERPVRDQAPAGPALGQALSLSDAASLCPTSAANVSRRATWDRSSESSPTTMAKPTMSLSPLTGTAAASPSSVVRPVSIARPARPSPNTTCAPER